MVNGMDRLGRKGFTLIELIATIVILAIIMGIGAYVITGLINDSKEKNYQLLLKEVRSAVEGYYQECMDPPKDSAGNLLISCPSNDASGYYNIKLGDLVTYGHLKGNASTDMGTLILTNPSDGNIIGDCGIRYKYDNGKIVVEAVNPTGSCPTNY